MVFGTRMAISHGADVIMRTGFPSISYAILRTLEPTVNEIFGLKEGYPAVPPSSGERSLRVGFTMRPGVRESLHFSVGASGSGNAMPEPVSTIVPLPRAGSFLAHSVTSPSHCGKSLPAGL